MKGLLKVKRSELLLAVATLLISSCSNSGNDHVVLPKFKIGDCFENISDLKKPLSDKGIFIYRVLEIEITPKRISWFSDNPNYGHYTTDTIYQASDRKFHSVREIPSFEHDPYRAKVSCPKKYN